MGFIMMCLMYLNTSAGEAKNFPDLKMFRMIQISVMLHIIFCTAGHLFEMGQFIGFSSEREIFYAVNTIYFIIVPIPAFLWFLICDYKVWGNMAGLKKRLRWYLIPLIANMIFVAFTPIHGLTFFLDGENIYHRGSLAVITWVVCWLYTLGTYPILAIKTKNKPALPFKGINIYYYAFQLLPVILSLVQIMFYGTLFISMAMVISTFIIFSTIHNKRLLEITAKHHLAKAELTVAKLENELTQSRIATMLTQIQPHFLYNSLTAIRELCYIDPKIASQTVDEFAEYLRFNLDSLLENKLIPFTKELTHTETYLKIEKKRFNKSLNIIYDINAQDFLLPALTLQPIVENAVLHGITPKDGGGTVTIRTGEDAGSFIITVTDDGMGFDRSASGGNISSSPQSSRSHIGIENVRSRLTVMSGGTLEVRSEVGKGTNAVIKIPKEKGHG